MWPLGVQRVSGQGVIRNSAVLSRGSSSRILPSPHRGEEVGRRNEIIFSGKPFPDLVFIPYQGMLTSSKKKKNLKPFISQLTQGRIHP